MREERLSTVDALGGNTLSAGEWLFVINQLSAGQKDYVNLR